MEQNQDITEELDINNAELPAIAQGINPRYQKYAQYYALTGNALEAGRLAGFRVPNEPGTGSILYKLKSTPTIAALIEHYQAIYAARSATSVEKLLTQLAQMANADVSETVTEDWETKGKSEIPNDILSAATGIEVKKTKFGKTVKITFAKEFAIDRLLQIHGLLKDEKHEAEGFSLVIQMAQGAAVRGAGTSGGPDVGSAAAAWESDDPEHAPTNYLDICIDDNT